MKKDELCKSCRYLLEYKEAPAKTADSVQIGVAGIFCSRLNYYFVEGSSLAVECQEYKFYGIGKHEEENRTLRQELNELSKQLRTLKEKPDKPAPESQPGIVYNIDNVTNMNNG